MVTNQRKEKSTTKKSIKNLSKSSSSESSGSSSAVRRAIMIVAKIHVTRTPPKYRDSIILSLQRRKRMLGARSHALSQNLLVYFQRQRRKIKITPSNLIRVVQPKAA